MTLRRTLLVAAGVTAMLSASPAGAHPPDLEVAAAAWNPDPLVLLALGVLLGIYHRGAVRLRAPAAAVRLKRRPRPRLMLGGVVLIALALLSPLDGLSSVLFSAHMIQHLLLVVFAPLLLVLARPGLPVMLGLPARLRRTVSRRALRLRPLVEGPVAAALAVAAHTLVMWLWHAPGLYEAALASPALHVFEHFTLFATSLAVWWIALNPARPGLGLLVLVFTALQGVALGALLTFAPRVLYPSYQTAAWGLSALEHQQLGGLFMWMPVGVVYAGLGLWLLIQRLGGPAGAEELLLREERQMAAPG